jgi:general stress protein CsbA
LKNKQVVNANVSEEEIAMSTPNNLKQLQQRVYWSYHQDGLVDIFFGLGLIGFGLMLLTGIIIYNILAWLPLAFYVPIKKAVTIPRLGYAQFETKRTLKWLVASLLIGATVLMLVLVLVIQIRNESLPASWRAILRAYDMLIIGGLLSIPLALSSALTGLRRLLGYIGLIFLVILAGIQFGIQPSFYMIAVGVAIMIVGCVYLARFMSRYPIHQPDMQNGGQPSGTRGANEL